MFGWLYRLAPRGLYGRAALILIVPIVTIQLVVSIAFIQRHFEDVTRQMTGNVVLDIGHVVRIVEDAPNAQAALDDAGPVASALQLSLTLPAAPIGDEDGRAFYDLSGSYLVDVLRTRIGALEGVDLSNRRRVDLTVETRHGLLGIGFERRRVSATNPHQLLVLMLATGLLMTAIAYVFLRNQIRPIRRLARAAEAFGKGRVFEFRPEGASEVRAAGMAFLDMRSRIERQIEQRTMMLSGISHDLRTPLTRLKLGLSMMDETPESEAMGRDIDEMTRLVDSFLEFMRSDAQEGEAEEVDPVGIIRDTVEDARRSGQDVSLSDVSGEGNARLRATSVRRAVQNLIGNAVRYGRRAEVSVAILDRAVRITVEDDGPGIPKDRREEALKPFSRLDSARNQDRGGGVGLGLAITADIARSHGGQLRLGDSERLGGLRAELILAR